MKLVPVHDGVQQTSCDIIADLVHNTTDYTIRASRFLFYPITLGAPPRETTQIDPAKTQTIALLTGANIAESLRTHAQTSTGEVALLSAVHVMGQRIGSARHEHRTYTELCIPMFDLRLPNSYRAFELLSQALRDEPMKLFKRLYVLESGHSFHLYGDRLLGTHEWLAFLGMVLHWRYREPFSDCQRPIANVSWCSHALERQGVATLRIGPRHKVNGFEARPEPQLVAVIS